MTIYSYDGYVMHVRCTTLVASTQCTMYGVLIRGQTYSLKYMVVGMPCYLSLVLSTPRDTSLRLFRVFREGRGDQEDIIVVVRTVLNETTPQ